jgi:hypothetical protein
MTEVSVISVQGRETLTRQTLEALAVRGGMAKRGMRGRFYWSGTTAPPTVHESWDVITCPIDRPHTISLMRLFRGVTPGADLLFFEDDIIPCRNAVVAACNFEVPESAGLVSFFDYRSEWSRPGTFIAPINRDLWGSQAIKIPWRVLVNLIPMLEEKIAMDAANKASPAKSAWDTWMGHAVEELGYRIGHYSPTLFQHGGAKFSIANIGTRHPYARNFPGEDWDALTECPDPVPSGPFTKYPLESCPFHRVIHPGGVVCRYWPIGRNERKDAA